MQNEATARIPFLQASIEAKEKFYYYFVEQKKSLHRPQQNVRFKGGSVIWPYL